MTSEWYAQCLRSPVQQLFFYILCSSPTTGAIVFATSEWFERPGYRRDKQFVQFSGAWLVKTRKQILVT